MADKFLTVLLFGFCISLSCGEDNQLPFERAASMGHSDIAAGSAAYQNAVPAAPQMPSSFYQASAQGSPSVSPILTQILETNEKSGMKYRPSDLGSGSVQVQAALGALEVLRQTLIGLSTQGTCSDGCDLSRWPKCTCISPATYDNEGRGNCNLGATKLDTKVWCYVDPRSGDPRKICPDAQPSNSKPGYSWSRIACIT